MSARAYNTDINNLDGADQDESMNSGPKPQSTTQKASARDFQQFASAGGLLA